MSFSVEKKPLHVPPLEEVALVLQSALMKCFAEASVSVVDCPDLTKAPYGLEAKGLCGSPRLADVGGIPNLMPVVQKDKLYDMRELANAVELPSAFIMGAGAGPHPFLGANSEIMANVAAGDKSSNGSLIAKVDADGNCQLMKLPPTETRCSILLNMFASEGQGGKVLHIKAKERIAEDTNLVTCMREGLKEFYGDKAVGLGGTFSLVQGHVKCHVMPDFPEAPLTCDADVNKWLKFYDMPAPMVFLSVLISKDVDLDCRLDHSHGYGKDYGGHYEYDTTPDIVKYEGYYNVAEFMFRIDRS